MQYEKDFCRQSFENSFSILDCEMPLFSATGYQRAFFFKNCYNFVRGLIQGSLFR